MTKVQTGMRISRIVFHRFKGLCRENGFGIGEVVEEFMKETLEIGDVQGTLDTLCFDRYVKANAHACILH